MSISVNAELDTELVRYAYSSLTTPTTVYDYNVRTREKTLLKRIRSSAASIPTATGPSFLFAPARDGARIRYRWCIAAISSATARATAAVRLRATPSTDPHFSSAR